MKGGMGSVWVATHLTLGHEVALKFIHVEGEARADALRRFEREARVIARLKSPYVVQVLDYGVDEANRPYLAMELLAGESLKARLDRVRSLSIEETARVVLHVCRAVHRAHAAGVVHRDLKPGNIFLCDDDDHRVKVLDFGIAKTVSHVGTDQQNTATGMIVGTPGYMSPEQALGREDLDGRSDLFSLGVVAWRCLTGRHPHERDGTPASFGELIVAVATQSVPLPSTVVSGIPLALDLWFARALATAPSERFSTAKEMADALVEALGMPSVPFTTGEHAAPAIGDALPSPTGPRLLGPSSRVHVRLGALHAGPPSADHSTMLNTATATSTPPQIEQSPKRGLALVVAAPVTALVVVLGIVIAFRATSRAAIPVEAPLASPVARPPALVAQSETEPTAATSSSPDDAGAKAPREDAPTPPRRPSPATSPPTSGAPRNQPSPAHPAARSSSEQGTEPRGRLLDDRL